MSVSQSFGTPVPSGLESHLAFYAVRQHRRRVDEFKVIVNVNNPPWNLLTIVYLQISITALLGEFGLWLPEAVRVINRQIKINIQSQGFW